MSGNITTVNNLVCSGNQTISGNIISTANIQTTAITSTNINNSNSISTNSINATIGALTNLSVNVLTLLANTPIIFNYNGSNYNLSTLMLYTLNQLSGASIASQSYVNTQIANLVNSSPDLLNTLSELANAIGNDSNFSTTMTNLIATKAGLTSNNNFSGANTFSNSTTGNIIDRLFSTVLSINNGNTRRSVANYFECGLGATSSYIYYDNSGKFGSINTNDGSLSWNIALNSVFNINTINSVNENISGTAIINNLYSNILAVNNNNTRRATNDIFEVATSSTGNYLYYNNTSVFGHINTSNSALSWYIDSNGLSSFKSLNVSGVSSTSNLCIGSSSMRTSSDKLNVSLSSTGPYLFFNDGGTLGTYNTNTSSFPWFVELDGDATFQSVNCNNLSVKNTKQQVTKTSAPTFTLSTSSSQMTYLNFSNIGYINLGQLDESCNFNIYEFRVVSNSGNVIVVAFGSAIVIDIDNVSRTNGQSIVSSTKKYYKFQYIYQFSGESVIHTYYQLN